MTASARELTVEVCTDEHTFAGLAEPWGRLHRACPSATAFQSHAWLHSWWLSYGTPGGSAWSWCAGAVTWWRRRR